MQKPLLLIFLTAALFLTPLVAPPRHALASSWGGMVTFTFDDGEKNVYENALPIFKKYGVSGAIYPVVQNVEDNQAGTVTWPQLMEFQAAGWEIGSHTMTHPHLSSLSDSALEYELKNSRNILAAHGLTAKTLVFPYGDYDARVLDYTTRYYENSRKAWGGAANGFDCDRYLITAKELSHTTRPEDAIAWIADAVQQQKWLVLLLHGVVTGTPGNWQYNAADLEQIVAYIAAHNIPVPTIEQAMARRQACLGPNLIANPDLEQLDDTGWALHWTRTNVADVSVGPVTVQRLFSSGHHLKIVGGPQANIANPAGIKLPDNKRPYFFSFFTELADTGENTGAEFYLNEYDTGGYWVGGKWLGGLYARTFRLPAYLYQPSSPRVDHVIIDIYTLAAGNLTFYGDNFFFGLILSPPATAINLLLLD